MEEFPWELGQSDVVIPIGYVGKETCLPELFFVNIIIILLLFHLWRNNFFSHTFIMQTEA